MDLLDSKKMNIGVYNSELASSLKKLSTINSDPITLTKDQLIQLYLMLYPMIVADFVSRTDFAKWEDDVFNDLKNKFSDHSNKLNNHTHTGNMGSPTSPPLQILDINVWDKHPEDDEYKSAEDIITNNSKYSNKIDHRDPSKSFDNVNLKNAKSIPEKYEEELILVPFDVNINTEELGDNKFAGSK